MRSPTTYLEGMKKSMTYKEKLFFLKEIDIASYDMIIDFGCAAGEMLSILDKLLPADSKTLLCGIDCYHYDDFCMTDHSCVLINSLDGIKPEALKDKKVLLILSSVLHEVPYEVMLALVDWANEYADTIVCRDMFFPTMYDVSTQDIKTLHRLSGFETERLKEIKETYDRKNESYRLTKILYEFFLKYTYNENWDSEVKEVYFCNHAWEFCRQLGGFPKAHHYYPFDITYFKTYVLPYKKKEIKKQFGYRMKYPTHIKFILRRR